MLLSRITVDPARFQFRTHPFSKRSVEGMVAAFNAAMFDPIPVIPAGARYVVAGDGHSRFEAVCRLAQQNRLPIEWMDGDDWDVPTREVSEKDALRLAYIANMGKAPFTPPEEARIFKARLDAGESVEEIAATSHRSTGYVRKHLTLNCLCQQIKDAISQPWGIDADKAIVLAEACERYTIPHAVQQDLWLKIISKGDWTQNSMKLFMQRFGQTFVASRSSCPMDDFLFELPPNAEEVVKQVTAMADERRRAQRGLQWLLSAKSALIDFPELLALLDRDGEAMVERVKQAQREDAEALHALVS